MKKLLDRMQKVQLTNAFAELENHGMAKVHFETQKGTNLEYYIIMAFGTQLITITEIDKATFELDIRE